MEVRQLPDLENMLSIVQCDKLINAVASNSVENGVLVHDDVIMLRSCYKRVEDLALFKLSFRSDLDLVRNLRKCMNQITTRKALTFRAAVDVALWAPYMLLDAAQTVYRLTQASGDRWPLFTGVKWGGIEQDLRRVGCLPRLLTGHGCV
jgi:hypothetical protein